MASSLGISRPFTSYRVPPYLGSQLASLFDPNAAAFFAAAGITDATQKSAVNQLVLDLKSASVWSKMAALYPFVGGTSSSCSYNLSNPATFQMTWHGSLTFDSTGITSDGVFGSYGDTGLNANTTTPNSLAFGFYSRTSAGSNAVDCGAYPGGASDIMEIWANAFGGNGFFDNQADSGRASGATTNGAGLFLSSRQGGNNTGYRNSTAIDTTLGVQGTLVNANFLICSRIGSETPSVRNFALFFISSGLTGADVTNFYNAVQTFQTTLGRNV